MKRLTQPVLSSQLVADTVGHTRLKILAALLDAQRARRLPSLRELRLAIGCTVNNVRQHIDGLLHHGLVAREPFQGRTLRPTCRFIPAEELGL